MYARPPSPTTAPPTRCAAFDFHLLAGSPAIDAGDAAARPAGATTDRDGHPRVVGPAVDLGAYERQAVP